MFFTAEMRYLQLIILEKDFQRAIDLLGEFGWIEINSGKENKVEKFKETNDKISIIEEKINQISDFLTIPKFTEHGSLLNLNLIEDYFSTLHAKIKPLKTELSELIEKRLELEKGLRELESYKNFKVTKSELESLNFMHFIVGSLSSKDLESLIQSMGQRVLYLELNKDMYIFFTSKKGRWTLESELKKLHFKEKDFPFENKILPSEVYKKLNNEIKENEKQIKKINLTKESLKNKELKNIINIIESFNLQKTYQDIFQKIDHSESTISIEGWILNKKLSPMRSKLKEILGNKTAIITFKPEEMEEVKNGALTVPVIMENFGIFKYFEKLIFNYGAPVYGTIDPTMIVTLSFLTLFGIMFGDMGQGFVILLTGIFMKFIKKFKELSPILMAIGVSSMIFGYLYGSAFCFEHEYLPFLSVINKALFKIDKPYIIYLSFNDVSSIISLFILTVCFGIALNLIGIIINIINNFKKLKIADAIFSRTGIAGFLFLISIIVIIFEIMILKIKISPVFVILSFFFVFLILLKEPVNNIVLKNKKIFDHGILMWILHCFIEIIEIILTTMSNNLSFIRVGAFAFAHFLLSLVILQLAEAIGGSIFSIPGIIIIVIGNFIIIVLEGMIVSIQTIRLHYYEFFSKFFTKLGKEFKPFKINKHKMEEI